MEIQIDKNEKRKVVKKIQIFIQNKVFTISIDKYGELVINKVQYGIEGIVIKPKASNTIELS